VIKIIRIKEFRENKKISQCELSKIIDVSQGTISLWESGQYEPSITDLVKLAAYFDCTIDDLIDKSRYDESTA